MSMKLSRTSASVLTVLLLTAPAPVSTQPSSAGLAFAAASNQTQRVAMPRDLYRLISVDDVVLAPDGEAVAYTVTRVLEEENGRERAVWVLPVRDGRPDGPAFRFTHSAADASSPRWSPDGTVLSFRSRRGDDPNDVWFAPVDRPGGEGQHRPGIRGVPIWSPEGARIAYLAEPPDAGAGSEGESGGAEPGAISPEAVSETLDPERFDGWVVTHLNFKRDGRYEPLPHPTAVPREQLWVTPVEGGEARRLTDLPYDVREATWASDGESIYFSVDQSQHSDMDFGYQVHVFEVDQDGTTRTQLTSGQGRRSGLTAAPDGSAVAFVYSRGYGAPTDLYVLPLGDGGPSEPRNVTEDWELEPGDPWWTSDGSALRFVTQDGGNRNVFEVPVRGGEPRQVTSGQRMLGSVSSTRDDAWLAFTSTDVTSPEEVHISRGDGSAEVRLTDLNTEWADSVALSPPERLTWTADGREIEGWMLKPAAGAEAGRSHPMVLNIHGGPHGAYGNRFSLQFQVLAGAGFYLFYLNPRGSSGYGHDFEWAIDEGWGPKDGVDFVRGVETALETYPGIDRERLGVTGWSYGGFMTNWLTARTDLFAAAVSGAAIADWESDFGTTDLWWTIYNEFGGPLWDARDVYRRLSPLSYVENVTAPTLVLHGELDVRVPYKNAEQWYKALKMRGVPTEMVRYPDSGHGIREPWLAADRLERTRSWFVHWLTGPGSTADGG